VQTPAKMYPHLKLLCWLFMGPTLDFATKQRNSFLIKVGVVTLKTKFWPRFFKIRLGLYSKKFQKCLIKYFGLSYEQIVISQLYLLVNHHRDHSSLLQFLIFMRSLSIVETSEIKLIPTPSWLVYFVLEAQPFFINFDSDNIIHS
jgi:hypothetical protein